MLVRGQHLLLVLIGLTMSQCASHQHEPGDDQSLNDVVDSTYEGKLSEASLTDEVRLVDPDSKLTVSFYSKNPLLAKAEFEGELEIYYLLSWHQIDGPLDATVTDMEIEESQMHGAIHVDVVELQFEGTFSEDRGSLELWLERIGTITLRRTATTSSELTVAPY